MIGNKRFGWIKKENKKNKDEYRYRKRCKMVDKEMEEMKMVGNNNEKDRLIKKKIEWIKRSWKRVNDGEECYDRNGSWNEWRK